MRAVEVIIWGFGAMGSGMAGMLLAKKGVEIKAVLDINPTIVGKSIFELLGAKRGDHPDVVVTDQVSNIIRPGGADIVLLATDSFVEATMPRLRMCLEAGLSVISTAEEMAYPAAQSPQLAEEIDRLARAGRASVLGTGINPGFVLDSLILALSATCPDVKSIYASRVNDLAPFGRAVMHEQGVGISKDEFHARVRQDSLAGHVGFPESVGLLAEGLGKQIDRLEQTKQPIVTGVYRKSAYGEAKEGHVAGIRQQVKAFDENGELFIHLDHPQQICPHLEGVATADTIEIDTGAYSVRMQISPEIPGGTGTIAMVVNSIPHVLNARDGLLTMLDLPLPRAVIGDFRALLNDRGIARVDGARKKAGDYVVIEFTVLTSEERAPGLPDETADVDLLARVKGHLAEDGRVGDIVTVRTLSGRLLQGRLTAESTAATHTYGPPVEALFALREDVKSRLANNPAD